MSLNDCCPWPGTDEMLDYVGNSVWNAVYTIQLGELIELGLFEWSDPDLSWENAAYDNEQYSRVCQYFIERFKYREISVEPLQQWKHMLQCAIVYEIMPKYKPLYAELESAAVVPLASDNEYYKGRKIGSQYPENLLAGNADYISTGDDEEFQRIHVTNPGEALQDYMALYRDVDKAILDELESFFISMYTANVNGY